MTGKTKVVVCVLAVIAAVMLLLSVTSCATSSNVVDGKAKLVTPEGHTCWLLEIDVESSMDSESEGEENYACVSKAEWNANQVGDEWRNANGVIK